MKKKLWLRSIGAKINDGLTTWEKFNKFYHKLSPAFMAAVVFLLMSPLFARGLIQLVFVAIDTIMISVFTNRNLKLPFKKKVAWVITIGVPVSAAFALAYVIICDVMALVEASRSRSALNI
ncbi:hypothetical protein HGB24_03640 [Candidatus Saccharibacteria bacterium]|nr:hypothetical protein [Candidatus Saccharibacteria bacterium]